MKTVLFYPTFLLQNYSVRKGEASLITQLEDTQAQHCDLLVKQNKKYKTDEEPFCSYPSGQVIPSQVGTTIWRAGGIIIGGPDIMGMWPPMGGLILGAGPQASSQEEKGPLLASWEYLLLPSNQEMIHTLRLTRVGEGQKPVQ